MKKKIFRIMMTALVAALLLAALTVACYAEKTLVAEGYCVNSEQGAAVQTNIKWEIFDEDGVQTLYFSIDASKNSTNTVLHAKDRFTGIDIPYYKVGSGSELPWGKYTAAADSKVKKAVVGDGITEINGAAFAYSAITTIEIPKTLVNVSAAAFNRASKLDTVNITGEEPNPGVVNVKYITSIPNNIFGGENRVRKYLLNPDYVGTLGNETFSKNLGLKEIEIPAGVTSLGNNIFTGTKNLSHLRILGKNTVLTNETFGGLEKYPRIVGYPGSAAETFAKGNGYTFINIETNEVIYEGTKPLVEITEGNIILPGDFDPTGSTAYGHLTGIYNGAYVVNTHWAYYDDTKTLRFISSATTGYNETGRLDMADDEKGWSDYLEKIEHVVVGDKIQKLTNEVFKGMKNLKSIELSNDVNQMGSAEVFNGCSSLTTMYYTGEKVEGLADFSKMEMLGGSFETTKVKVVKLGTKNETLEVYLPLTTEKIITPYYTSEYFDDLCKENMYDLQDANNSVNIKKYFVELKLDPNWTMCGLYSAFEFDEATGVLTVHGKGVIDDIANYYGGGSKNQPWFSIKDKVKHIVITEYIKTIGKYAFAEFANLETVCLPNVESIEILNAAFEKCYNLKSVYVEGNEPIEGTFDLRLVKDELFAWTFAYNYLVANVIVDESVEKIGKTTFEENLGVNLTGIYGVPGSFAETYAEENGLTFHDISSGMPTAVTCTPPESTDSGDTMVDSESEEDTTAADVDTDELESNLPDTSDDTADSTALETEPVESSDAGNTPEPKDGGSATWIVIVAAAVVLVAACVVVFMIKAKKSPKNDK